jgi:hypothetical protein
MKKRIAEMEPGVDVFRFGRRKCRVIMKSQFFPAWYICRTITGGYDVQLHGNKQFEIVGCIGADGKMAEVEG